MFAQKKMTFDVTPGDPEITVRYAGKTETYVAIGKGCTHSAVQRIWDNSPEEHRLPRVSLHVSPSGLVLTGIDRVPGFHNNQLKFHIRHIAYCSAEKGAHDRVVSWIGKNGATKRLECHAVLCQSQEKAKWLAMTLHSAFQVAFQDWKAKKDKESRVKNNQQQQQQNVSSAGPQKRAQQTQRGMSVTNGNGVSHGNALSREVSRVSSTNSDDSSDYQMMDAAYSQMNAYEDLELTWTDQTITEPPRD